MDYIQLRNQLLRTRTYLAHPDFLRNVAWHRFNREDIVVDVSLSKRGARANAASLVMCAEVTHDRCFTGTNGIWFFIIVA
jgi:hypothetical protein